MGHFLILLFFGISTLMMMRVLGFNYEMDEIAKNTFFSCYCPNNVYGIDEYSTPMIPDLKNVDEQASIFYQCDAFKHASRDDLLTMMMEKVDFCRQLRDRWDTHISNMDWVNADVVMTNLNHRIVSTSLSIWPFVPADLYLCLRQVAHVTRQAFLGQSTLLQQDETNKHCILLQPDKEWCPSSSTSNDTSMMNCNPPRQRICIALQPFGLECRCND